jgi:hypothetical protein
MYEDGNVIHEGHMGKAECVGEEVEKDLEIGGEEEAGEGAALFDATRCPERHFLGAQQASASLLENRK